MKHFTTRVELHAAVGADYDALHRFMADLKFQRFVTNDDGREYQLPTAEYASQGDLRPEDVRTLAAQAASRTGRSFWILVTEGAHRAWTLPELGRV